MVGPILALIAGTAFAVGGIFVRRGIHRGGEAYSPMAISVFSGFFVIGLWLFISGGAASLRSVSWLGLGLLILAGGTHFLLGRWLYCIGIQLIGANRAVPIVACSILIAALMGVFLLGEPFTRSLIAAVSLIVTGMIMVGTASVADIGELSMAPGALLKGVLAALGTAFCWGVSPVLLKVGLQEVGSPLLALFIALGTAFVAVSISLSYPGNRRKLRRLTRFSLTNFLIASIGAGVTGMMLRMLALSYSPVSVVEPLIASATNLLIFPLSLLVNRKIEAFNTRIILGAVAIAMGIFLVFYKGSVLD